MLFRRTIGATFLSPLFFRRANGSHGFIPANYVQEIEQKLVAVEVKKPVVIKDVRKVKKTQYVKQPTAPAANQRSGTGAAEILQTLTQT